MKGGDVQTSFNQFRIYRRCIFFACLFLLFTGGISEARIFFYPGDAFFHSIVTAESRLQLARWRAGPVRLRYEPPASPPVALGAHLGFAFIDINGWNTDLNGRLVSGFRMCDADDVVDEQPSKIHFFIYGDDFDCRRFRIGLKYNESWMDPVENGISPDTKSQIAVDGMYSPFCKSKEMIVEDWLHAKDVGSLDATLPQAVKWKQLGKYIDAPVTINADKCRFRLVKESELQRVIKRKSGARFVEISGSDVTVLIWKDGGWTAGKDEQ